MDGSNDTTHGHSRLPQERLLKKPTLHLPMTAIDSFLGHSRRHFSNHPDLEINPSSVGNKKEKKLTVPSFEWKNQDHDFGYDQCDGISGSCSYHNLQIGGGETFLGFSNELGFDGVGESIDYVRDTDETSGGVSRSHLSISSVNPKRKKKPQNGLIKGQWTLDEDR